jgi:hypothetical protein
MNQLAGKCNVRVREMATETEGPDLCRFVFAPFKGIISESPGPLCIRGWDSEVGRTSSDTDMGDPILRQDDARVRAVQSSSEDLLERAMELADPHHYLQVNELGITIDSSESVSGRETRDEEEMCVCACVRVCSCK